MAARKRTGGERPPSARAKAPRARGTPRPAAAKKPAKSRRWSQRVTARSDAMDLENGVFTKGDAAAVARSLKRSAERSSRRKAGPYQSAMSMLDFFINRAGKQLSLGRRRILERAKIELRALFHRPQRA